MSHEVDIDLEYWMTNLPENLKAKAITDIAIPGTHDSMTYSISSRSPIAPDFECILRRHCFTRIVSYVMARWAKTQDFTVEEQLKCGIRYFDLRVATKDGSHEFYFVHGLYAAEVYDVLSQVKEFLKDHPKEIVIIDFNHFYAFTGDDHSKLIDTVHDIFGHSLVPLKHTMDILSLDYMTNKHSYQVFCIYRSQFVPTECKYLWPSAYFPSPWPNTVDETYLIETLSNNLKKRNPEIAYITQFLLTPDVPFILKNGFSSLKKKCASPLVALLSDWLQNQNLGQGGVNIVIVDFMNISSCQFSKEVVGLNYKSLKY